MTHLAPRRNYYLLMPFFFIFTQTEFFALLLAFLLFY
jgi:hypothetical protein